MSAQPKVYGLVILLFLFTTSWGQTVDSVSPTSRLKFLDEYEVPFNYNFKSTTVGGLSGIDYDRVNDLYYMICDDRSSINPSRFYTAQIKIENNKIDTVTFVDVHTLRQPNGHPYPDAKKDPTGATDPESMRFDGKRNQLVWTSEGERIKRKTGVDRSNPSITITSTEGKYIDAFPLPPNLIMQGDERGPRQNGVLEGVTFNSDFTTLYVSVEEPLYEDGPRADVKETDSYVRIFQFDMASKENTKQYAYKLEPVAFPALTPTAFKVNGISEILYAGEDKLLVIERSFSTGRLSCTIRVFLAELSQADNIKAVASLKEHPPTTEAKKTLLLNMDDLGRYIDNIEGVCYGPKLPNGHQTLIFISDNNFNFFEKMQFFLFEIIP